MKFNELLVEVNSRLQKFLGEEKSDPISERTLRYWISKGVLSKRVSRGPKTTYPESFIWRVILTRQYQLFSTKTLDEIAEVQNGTADRDAIIKVRAFRKHLRYRQPLPDSGVGEKIPEFFLKGPKNADAPPRSGHLTAYDLNRKIEDITQRIEGIWSQVNQLLQVQDEMMKQVDSSARKNCELDSHLYHRQSEEFENLSMMLEKTCYQMRAESKENSARIDRIEASIKGFRDDVAYLVKTIGGKKYELEEQIVALKHKKEED